MRWMSCVDYIAPKRSDDLFHVATDGRLSIFVVVSIENDSDFWIQWPLIWTVHAGEIWNGTGQCLGIKALGISAHAFLDGRVHKHLDETAGLEHGPHHIPVHGE